VIDWRLAELRAATSSQRRASVCLQSNVRAADRPVPKQRRRLFHWKRVGGCCWPMMNGDTRAEANLLQHFGLQELLFGRQTISGPAQTSACGQSGPQRALVVWSKLGVGPKRQAKEAPDPQSLAPDCAPLERQLGSAGGLRAIIIVAA